MGFLENLDQQIFFIVNHKCHVRSLDKWMPYWRSMYFWFPLYLFFVSHLWLTYGKKSLYLLLFLVGTVFLSDTLSSKCIKPMVARTRPCNDVRIKDKVKLLVNPSSGKSFPSSHAANHFAVAVFLSTLFATPRRWLGYLLMLWAASIAFGQVYVGIHYPLDVLAGGLLGASMGYWTAFLYKKYISAKIIL